MEGSTGRRTRDHKLNLVPEDLEGFVQDRSPATTLAGIRLGSLRAYDRSLRLSLLAARLRRTGDLGGTQGNAEAVVAVGARREVPAPERRPTKRGLDDPNCS
jgi:hypothetical protein